MKDIWVIIPGFNEEKYLAKVIKGIKKHTTNIIYVDDGSQDQSVLIAKKLISHVLIHQINLGKGAALKTACDYAFDHLKAKHVIFMDADDQHNPAQLVDFFAALKNSDLVFGVRSLEKNMPRMRVFLNKLLSYTVQMLFGQYIPDILSGFKAISKNIYHKIKWDNSGYGIELEIAAKVAKLKLPFKIIKIDTIYHEFDRGMTLIDSLKLITHLINLKAKL